MLRLFIALQLDPSIIEQLQNICFGIKNARWLPSDQIHVTVRFIGNCDESLFYDIKNSLDTVSIPVEIPEYSGLVYNLLKNSPISIMP